ncbi:MAG: DsrE family protein [Deltaproteobacteria bacterium]|nr:DsrE family protein [Deltaproteobacteria bacterium]
MSILHILETAFRGTIEEQDDTVIWTVHAMRKAGQEGSVVLQGNIVGHAVRGQDATGLQFGDHPQTNPVDLAGDMQKLMAAGVPIYVVEGDAADRGIAGADLIAGVQLIDRAGVAGLADSHDLVWHW